jgi:hypothetical protein
MEAVMSRLTLSAALLAALLLPTASFAAPRVAHIRQHGHAHVVGPGIVGPNWDLYGPDLSGLAPIYSGGSYAPLGGGALYGRESGGVNSMSNDFGTSGVLGHTNGMPATVP